MISQMFRNDEGVWIELATQDGKKALLNLTELTRDSGPMVRSVVAQWAAEPHTCPHCGRTGVPA